MDVINRDSPSITIEQLEQLLRLAMKDRNISYGDNAEGVNLGIAGASFSSLPMVSGISEEENPVFSAIITGYAFGPFSVLRSAFTCRKITEDTSFIVYVRTPPRNGYVDLINASPFCDISSVIPVQWQTHYFKNEETQEYIKVSGYFCIDAFHDTCVINP